MFLAMEAGGHSLALQWSVLGEGFHPPLPIELHQTPSGTSAIDLIRLRIILQVLHRDPLDSRVIAVQVESTSISKIDAKSSCPHEPAFVALVAHEQLIVVVSDGPVPGKEYKEDPSPVLEPEAFLAFSRCLSWASMPHLAGAMMSVGTDESKKRDGDESD
jgi:hypothetical protein